MLGTYPVPQLEVPDVHWTNVRNVSFSGEASDTLTSLYLELAGKVNVEI